MILMVHADGDNVLSQEGVRRIFEALDLVRNTPGYDKACSGTDYVDPATGELTCEITSVTSFWNDSTAIFEQSVLSDEDAITAMSADRYPDGTPTDIAGVVGYPVAENGTLTFVQSYLAVIIFPDHSAAEDFEKDAIDNLWDLQKTWDLDSSSDFRVEFIAERSFPDEFTRAIVKDIPLVPAVFIVMSVFTCLVFFKRDPVASRTFLGFGAVISVLLSIMTGYGLLFLIGMFM